MKQLAAMIAVTGFFVLAIVGWCSGVCVDVCAIKAFGGALAIYVMLRVAGRLAAGILADSVVRSLSEVSQRGSNE